MIRNVNLCQKIKTLWERHMIKAHLNRQQRNTELKKKSLDSSLIIHPILHTSKTFACIM